MINPDAPSITDGFDAEAFVDDEHQFGGAWTLLKLETVERYLVAYTNALKKQSFHLHYFDGFAGTGRCDVTAGNGKQAAEGSAVRALGIDPPFHSFTFVDASERNVAALRRLKALHPSRDIEVIQGDANAVLSTMCAPGTAWSNRRAVVFLDPFGMNVEWSTLRAVASTKAIDVWYLFPLSGVYRQAARDPDNADAKKAASLTRVLGTEEWRTAWYRERPQKDMFDSDVKEERHFDHKQITAWVTSRLQTIFPGVVGPRILYSVRNGHDHSPLYALYFLVSNPKPAARALACRIAQHVLETQ